MKNRSIINGRLTIYLTIFFIIFFLAYGMYFDRGTSLNDYEMMINECTLLYGEDKTKLSACYDLKVDKTFNANVLRIQIIFGLIFLPSIVYIGSRLLKGSHKGRPEDGQR